MLNKKIKKKKPTQVKISKPQRKPIPFPEDGGFFEYLFWFMTERTRKFVGILIMGALLLAFLATDIGRYKDTNGKFRWSFNKKAMEIKTLKKQMNNLVP